MRTREIKRTQIIRKIFSGNEDRLPTDAIFYLSCSVNCNQIWIYLTKPMMLSKQFENRAYFALTARLLSQLLSHAYLTVIILTNLL